VPHTTQSLQSVTQLQAHRKLTVLVSITRFPRPYHQTDPFHPHGASLLDYCYSAPSTSHETPYPAFPDSSTWHPERTRSSTAFFFACCVLSLLHPSVVVGQAIRLDRRNHSLHTTLKLAYLDENIYTFVLCIERKAIGSLRALSLDILEKPLGLLDEVISRAHRGNTRESLHIAPKRRSRGITCPSAASHRGRTLTTTTSKPRKAHQQPHTPPASPYHHRNTIPTTSTSTHNGPLRLPPLQIRALPPRAALHPPRQAHHLDLQRPVRRRRVRLQPRRLQPAE